MAEIKGLFASTKGIVFLCFCHLNPNYQHLLYLGEQKETVSWRQTEKGMKCSRYFKGGKHCPIKVKERKTYDHHPCHSIGITHLEHLLILSNLLITSDEYNVSFSLDLKT